MLSATNSNGVGRVSGTDAEDGASRCTATRLSVAQAVELLARERAWINLPTREQLALYRRESGAYFCAVEGCSTFGPPERGKDEMVTIGPLVFCHTHGRQVHGKLRGEHGADRACRWHYLSMTLHFSRLAEEKELDCVSAARTESARLPLRFVSADEVAEAILGGQRVEYAGKRPRADGYGQETQCVVAANAPELCDYWGDWGMMPTASAPSRDAWPSRAHYGFCPECAEVCTAAELALGPPLRQMVTGRKSEALRAPYSSRPTPHSPETSPESDVNGDVPICTYCQERPGIQRVGSNPACKRCKNVVTRAKRESKAVARSDADRQYGAEHKGHNPSPPNSFKKAKGKK